MGSNRTVTRPGRYGGVWVRSGDGLRLEAGIRLLATIRYEGGAWVVEERVGWDRAGQLFVKRVSRYRSEADAVAYVELVERSDLDGRGVRGGRRAVSERTGLPLLDA